MSTEAGQDQSISAGDLDGDGYDDLALGATGPNPSLGPTYLAFGSATGITLSTASPFPAGFYSEVADLNGDGAADVMGADYTGPTNSALDVWNGSATRDFGSPIILSSARPAYGIYKTFAAE